MGNAISTVDEAICTLYEKYYPKTKWLSPIYVTAAGMFAYLAKNIRRSESLKLTNTDSFIYFFFLSSTVGLQIWQTFIAEATMIRVLPRHQYGDVQSYIFPKYFLLNTLYTFGNLAIYTKLYPFATWKNEYATLGYILAGSFVANVLNSVWFSPGTMKNMQDMHNLEKRAGVGLTSVGVGQLMLESKIENDPEYKEAKGKYHAYRGLSSFTNFLSLTAAVTQVYLLTHKQYALI